MKTNRKPAASANDDKAASTATLSSGDNATTENKTQNGTTQQQPEAVTSNLGKTKVRTTAASTTPGAVSVDRDGKSAAAAIADKRIEAKLKSSAAVTSNNSRDDKVSARIAAEKKGAVSVQAVDKRIDAKIRASAMPNSTAAAAAKPSVSLQAADKRIDAKIKASNVTATKNDTKVVPINAVDKRIEAKIKASTIVNNDASSTDQKIKAKLKASANGTLSTPKTPAEERALSIQMVDKRLEAKLGGAASSVAKTPAPSSLEEKKKAAVPTTASDKRAQSIQTINKRMDAKIGASSVAPKTTAMPSLEEEKEEISDVNNNNKSLPQSSIIRANRQAQERQTQRIQSKIAKSSVTAGTAATENSTIVNGNPETYQRKMDVARCNDEEEKQEEKPHIDNELNLQSAGISRYLGSNEQKSVTFHDSFEDEDPLTKESSKRMVGFGGNKTLSQLSEKELSGKISTASHPGSMGSISVGLQTGQYESNGHSLNELEHGESSNPICAFVVPEPVDKEELDRREMDRMVAFAPVVDGVIPESQRDIIEKKKGKRCSPCKIGIFFALLAAIALAIALPITLTKSSSSGPQTSERFQKISAELQTIYLDNGYNLGSLSNISSPQYKALSWLADEDAAQIKVDDTQNLTQRFALATIYFASGGGGWKDQLNFLSVDHVCNWHAEIEGYEAVWRHQEGAYIFEFFYDFFVDGKKGAFCNDSTGLLEAIDFTKNNVTGTLPEEISLLSDLRHFSMNRNSLQGSLPSSLYDLHLMENIHFSENQMTGTISSDVLNFKNLNTFGVTTNFFHGTFPESFGMIPSITLIAFSDNELTGTIPTSINNLSKLEVLALPRNHFVGTLPFNNDTNMPHLWHFSIDVNNFTGPIPEAMTGLSGATELWLSRNLLTGTIPDFSKISNLTWLSVLGNNLNGTVPPTIGDVSNLLYLELSSNDLTGTLPTSMEKLANLFYLDIDNNQFVGTVPQALPDLSFGFFQHNNLNGSVNFLCSPETVLFADCHGDKPEITCDCCLGCCDAEGTCFGPGGCIWNYATFECA